MRGKFAAPPEVISIKGSGGRHSKVSQQFDLVGQDGVPPDPRGNPGLRFEIVLRTEASAIANCGWVRTLYIDSKFTI